MGRDSNAVVLGAGMAGLITARVLSKTYETVTVVDRDPLPDASVPRRGVPQSRQLHLLLARGSQALDELFEGLSEELNARGAPIVDLNDQVHWFNDGYRMHRAPSEVIAVGVSRPLLETTVRARVQELPNVRFHRPAEATELLSTAERRRIIGVLVTPRDGAAERLDADLVVDLQHGDADEQPQLPGALHGFGGRVAGQGVDTRVGRLTGAQRSPDSHACCLVGPETPAAPCGPGGGSGDRALPARRRRRRRGRTTPRTCRATTCRRRTSARRPERRGRRAA